MSYLSLFQVILKNLRCTLLSLVSNNIFPWVFIYVTLHVFAWKCYSSVSFAKMMNFFTPGRPPHTGERANHNASCIPAPRCFSIPWILLLCAATFVSQGQAPEVRSSPSFPFSFLFSLLLHLSILSSALADNEVNCLKSKRHRSWFYDNWPICHSINKADLLNVLGVSTGGKLGWAHPGMTGKTNYFLGRVSTYHIICQNC